MLLKKHTMSSPFWALLLLFVLMTPLYSQQPAFPGAEGFGSLSLGGRGGAVIKVTNLNDSGPGSLRNAVNQQQKRIIIFDVSGIIELQSFLIIANPYCTIAGQTAPGDGITLKNYPLIINASHVVVRYIRSRLGEKAGKADAISVTRGNNIILDHCSASWSVDEVLSNQSDDVDSITVQWCMVTESLNNSVHSKGKHGYGGIIGSKNQTFHHNLYAHHISRTPKVSWRRPALVDFRNNVIYNWQHNNCYDGTDAHMNWVANYYKYGPATEHRVQHRIFQLSDESNNTDVRTAKLYAEENYVWGFPAVTADNWAGGIDFNYKANRENNRAYEPFACPPVAEQSPAQAYERVLEHAGASMARDIIDARIILEIEKGTYTYGTGGIIDSPKDVGGWPDHLAYAPFDDSDQDGIPDYWEAQYQLDAHDPLDGNGDADHDGYLQIEEYLNNTNAVDDGKSVVHLQTMHSRANGSQAGELVFRRSGDLDKKLTLSFSVQGTAKSGIDYQPLPDSVTFLPGKEKVTLKVHGLDQKNGEHDNFLTIQLHPGEQHYYIGCPARSLIGF